MSDEPELLPCPFCGGVEHEVGYDSAGHDVQCHSWTCRAKTGSHTTEAEALAAWNRRAAPQRIEVDIGAAAAALKASPELAAMINDALAVAKSQATPSRESSDELAALAARYLGMSDGEFTRAMADWLAYGDPDVFADIKRLAGSVLSQAENDK